MILFIDALTVADRLVVVEAMTSENWRSKFSSSFQVGVRPSGWTVPESFPMRHDDLVRFGIRANVVTTLLSDLGATATTIVIHGRERVLRAIEKERAVDGRPREWVRRGVEIRCTARAAAGLVKIANPSAKGAGDDQWLLPTLEQCRRHFNIADRGVDAVAAVHEHLVKAKALEAA